MRQGALTLIALILIAVAGCSSAGSGLPPVPAPAEPSIAVDTAQLRQLKTEAGVADCVPGAATASALPAVTLPCLGGGPSVDLASLQGPLILNFWFAGCAPCRSEMPVLGDFERRYGDRVAVIGIDSLDTTPGVALQQAGRRDATYPQLADTGGVLGEQAAFANSNRGRPYTAFVDADGEVVGEELGGFTTLEDLVAKAEDYLELDLSSAG